ncbi:hypothetical protein K7432_004796 [Basidiobolus ranarum]|uniref:Zn(2)-C6 fungal-type domain-containing protein n=1 Tax=Basidiobolus ranarum TaxID=34480 RepID=A0ABR2WXJ5_9FUNG
MVTKLPYPTLVNSPMSNLDISNQILAHKQNMLSTYGQQYNPETARNHSYKPKKRQQVKNACVNCQKACKKCDEGRPCSRCIKYGLTDTCADSPRKARKKGVKRGPYKRRKALNNVHGNNIKREVRANVTNPESNLYSQSRFCSEESYTTQNSYFQNSSQNYERFKPTEFMSLLNNPTLPQVPSISYPRDTCQDVLSVTNLCEKREPTNDLRRLLNPQLQCPQPRRFSVELPLPLKVDLAPRASSVEPDHRYCQEVYPAQENMGGPLIEIPTLPSIATITSKTNQPPTPVPVLPPLMNISSVSTIYGELKKEEGTIGGMDTLRFRKRSISPSESETSLPASPTDLGYHQQHNIDMVNRLPPISLTQSTTTHHQKFMHHGNSPSRQFSHSIVN